MPNTVCEKWSRDAVVFTKVFFWKWALASVVHVLYINIYIKRETLISYSQYGNMQVTRVPRIIHSILRAYTYIRIYIHTYVYLFIYIHTNIHCLYIYIAYCLLPIAYCYWSLLGFCISLLIPSWALPLRGLGGQWWARSSLWDMVSRCCGFHEGFFLKVSFLSAIVLTLGGARARSQLIGSEINIFNKVW